MRCDQAEHADDHRADQPPADLNDRALQGPDFSSCASDFPADRSKFGSGFGAQVPYLVADLGDATVEVVEAGIGPSGSHQLHASSVGGKESNLGHRSVMFRLLLGFP